jgi:hypothetical protein
MVPIYEPMSDRQKDYNALHGLSTTPKIVGYSVDLGNGQFGNYDANKNFLGNVSDNKGGFMNRVAEALPSVVMSAGLNFITAGAASAIGASLTTAGIVSSTAAANAVGAAIVNAGVSAAQGVPMDKALENAAMNVITSQVISPAIASEVKSVIDSPVIQQMATNAGTSIVVGTAQGKSSEEITKSAIGSATGALAVAAGKEVGTQILYNIEDPIIAKIASDAASAGVNALIKGGNAGKAALDAGATTLANSNIDFGDTLSGIKEAIEPISAAATSVLQPLEQPVKEAAQKASDVVTSVAQPVSDVATQVLQPAEKPIKEAAQKASDVVTSATEPLRQGFQAASDVVTSATEPLKSAAKTVGTDVSDAVSKIPTDNLDKSIIDLMSKAPTANKPAVSNVAAGGESASGGGGSASSYGGADVAMLGDTSEAGLGSKVSKKGGKYPWGEPEGTTALKEGLGI